MVNRFTTLDAYTVLNIDELVNKVAQYKILSTVDLKSTYYQVPIFEKAKIYTAFEADGKLHQFCRVPFGVTTEIAYSRRIIYKFIADNSLSQTFGNLDNISMVKEENDENLNKFTEASKKFTIIINALSPTLQWTFQVTQYLRVQLNQILRDFDCLKNFSFLLILMLFVMRCLTISNGLPSILKK